MICYRVGRRFFTMKDVAETERKAAGLLPAATQKLEIKGRDDLVSVLNALATETETEQDTSDEDDRPAGGPQPIPDYVPKFLHPK